MTSCQETGRQASDDLKLQMLHLACFSNPSSQIPSPPLVAAPHNAAPMATISPQWAPQMGFPFPRFYKTLTQELLESQLPAAELRYRLKVELQKGPLKSRLTIGEACRIHDQVLLAPPVEKRHNLLLPAYQLCEYSPFAVHRGANHAVSRQMCGCTDAVCRETKPLKFFPSFKVGTKALLHSYSRVKQMASMTPMGALAALAVEEAKMNYNEDDDTNTSTDPVPLKMMLDTSTEHKFQATISVSGLVSKKDDATEYRLPIQCVSSYCNFPKRASVLCTRSEVAYCFPLPDEHGNSGVYIIDAGVKVDEATVPDWDRDWDRRNGGLLIGINLRGTYAGLCPGRTYEVGYYRLANAEPEKRPVNWSFSIRREEWNPQSTAGPGRKVKARERAENMDYSDIKVVKRKRAPAKRRRPEDVFLEYGSEAIHREPVYYPSITSIKPEDKCFSFPLSPFIPHLPQLPPLPPTMIHSHSGTTGPASWAPAVKSEKVFCPRLTPYATRLPGAASLVNSLVKTEC